MRTASSNNMPVVIGQPEKNEDPNYFIADDFEQEDIQAAVDELAPLWDEYRWRSFQSYYDVGEVVKEHYDKVQEEREERGRSMYGQRFFARLAQDLGRPNVDGQILHQCFKLVETYSKEEIRKLCQHDAITPTHTLMLACIEGDERAALEQKVISENLTTKQLLEAGKEMFGVRRKPGAGRPPKRPKKLKDAFLRLMKQAEQFIKLNKEIWFGDAYDIVSEIKDLPADSLTDEFKAKITEAVKVCDNLAATATKDAETLRNTLPEIERRMKAQAKLMAQQRAEEEGEP